MEALHDPCCPGNPIPGNPGTAPNPTPSTKGTPHLASPAVDQAALVIQHCVLQCGCVWSSSVFWRLSWQSLSHRLNTSLCAVAAGCCPDARKGMPWSVRFPDLATVLDDHPGWPAYNEVMYNTYTNTGKFQTGMSAEQIAGYLSVLANNTEV